MEGSLVAYKVFTNGSVLNASEINDNLMNQSTAVFSNEAARTAAITSPVEGQVTFLEDQNILSIYDGSAWKTSLAPTGSILQVVMGTTTTSTTTTEVGGTNTALSVSITPKSASNKILVISDSAQMNHSNSLGGSELRLRRDSTDLNANAVIYFGTSGSNLNIPMSLSILDSPNTTSSVTYRTRISTGNASNATTVAGRQNIIVMEVAG
jgi:hypothetical protein